MRFGPSPSRCLGAGDDGAALGELSLGRGRHVGHWPFVLFLSILEACERAGIQRTGWPRHRSHIRMIKVFVESGASILLHDGLIEDRRLLTGFTDRAMTLAHLIESPRDLWSLWHGPGRLGHSIASLRFGPQEQVCLSFVGVVGHVLLERWWHADSVWQEFTFVGLFVGEKTIKRDPLNRSSPKVKGENLTSWRGRGTWRTLRVWRLRLHRWIYPIDIN